MPSKEKSPDDGYLLYVSDGSPRPVDQSVAKRKTEGKTSAIFSLPFPSFRETPLLYVSFGATASILAYSGYCLYNPRLQHRLRNLYRGVIAGNFTTLGFLIFYLYRDKYLPEQERERAANAALVEARNMQDSKK